MTRLWTPGKAIQVTEGPAGDPLQIRWDGQVHPVAAITRRWRVDTDWWRRRVWRAYYKLSTETGLLLEVYRDLEEGGWYVQRLYD